MPAVLAGKSRLWFDRVQVERAIRDNFFTQSTRKSDSLRPVLIASASAARICSGPRGCNLQPVLVQRPATLSPKQDDKMQERSDFVEIEIKGVAGMER
jgi:hypothetical protein